MDVDPSLLSESDLRTELAKRGLDCNGLRDVLLARLQDALAAAAPEGLAPNAAAPSHAVPLAGEIVPQPAVQQGGGEEEDDDEVLPPPDEPHPDDVAYVPTSSDTAGMAPEQVKALTLQATSLVPAEMQRSRSRSPPARMRGTGACNDGPSEGRKLFIGNLGALTTEEDLRRTFGAFGAIAEINMRFDKHTGKFRGIAFAEFESADQAQAALKAKDGTDLHGRSMQVSIAKPRGFESSMQAALRAAPGRQMETMGNPVIPPGAAPNYMGGMPYPPSASHHHTEPLDMKKLHVSNLDFNTTKEDVEELFGRYDTIEKVAMVLDRETGGFRGFAYVTFASEEGASRAREELNGAERGGRDMRINFAKMRNIEGGPGGSKVTVDRFRGDARMYVGNLDFRSTKADIEHEFSSFGEVLQVDMRHDHDTGQFRGIAFVTMSDPEAAANAINARNNTESSFGRLMKMSVAKPKGQGGRYDRIRTGNPNPNYGRSYFGNDVVGQQPNRYGGYGGGRHGGGANGSYNQQRYGGGYGQQQSAYGGYGGGYGMYGGGAGGYGQQQQYGSGYGRDQHGAYGGGYAGAAHGGGGAYQLPQGGGYDRPPPPPGPPIPVGAAALPPGAQAQEWYYQNQQR